MLMFVLYFLAAVGVLLGSHMDTSSKALQSIRATSMLEVSSYKQIKDQIPAGARVFWAVFTVANAILVMLTIAVGVIGLATMTPHSIGSLGILGMVYFLSTHSAKYSTGAWKSGVNLWSTP